MAAFNCHFMTTCNDRQSCVTRDKDIKYRTPSNIQSESNYYPLIMHASYFTTTAKVTSLKSFIYALVVITALSVSSSHACDDNVKIIKVESPMLNVYIESATKVRVSNPFLTSSTDGASKNSGDSNVPSSSSVENGFNSGSNSGTTNSLSKRAADDHALLQTSDQYFDVYFDDVYILHSFKINCGERKMNLQYSRPEDEIPFGRQYKNRKGQSDITLNEFFDEPIDNLPELAEQFFPQLAMSRLRFNLVDIKFENKSTSQKSFSINFQPGVCKFSVLESYTVTEPSSDFPDTAYDGTVVSDGDGGLLTGGLGYLVFAGKSDNRFVEWKQNWNRNVNEVNMDFAFRFKQKVSTVEFEFDKPIYSKVYLPGQITCYALFEPRSDISKSEKREWVVDDDQATLITMSFDLIAQSLHCEMKFRTNSGGGSDTSIRVKLITFNSENATAEEIAAADPEKDKIDPSEEGATGDETSNTGDESSGDGTAGSGSSSNEDNSESGGGGGGVAPVEQPNFPFDDAQGMQYLTLVIFVMAALCGVILTVAAIGVGWICYRRKKYKLKKKYESAYSKSEFLLSGMPVEHPYQALSQLDQYETPRYHLNNTVDLQSGRQLPDIPPPAPISQHHTSYPNHEGSLASSRIYTEPDIVSQVRDQPNLSRAAAGGSDSLARNVARAYAETDITQIQSGIFGGTFEMSNVLEYPKNNLIFIKELGKGQFATVHLCLAPGIRDSNPETPVKVAVKFLHADAIYEQREAFKKEVKVLADLRHPNIIMLYGVCTRSGPPMMILEFMENGDLYQFLRRHEPELASYASSSNIQTLSAQTLVSMALQIASGMAHVESVNFIHRDLASRNCLVGISYTVKIGDFGMSRELYSNDYYKIEGKAVLPIRWMAWESIVMGKFSNKSDVWSFGVLLWELFTLAKCQPFSNRTDEQVIENLTNIWEKKESEILPQPGNCPNEIYELMKTCWHSSPDLRPNFQQIQNQLTKISTYTNFTHLDFPQSIALSPNNSSGVPGGPPSSVTLPSGIGLASAGTPNYNNNPPTSMLPSTSTMYSSTSANPSSSPPNSSIQQQNAPLSPNHTQIPPTSAFLP